MVDESSKLTLVSASNDNDPSAEARVEAVVMEIARILGRQIARDVFRSGQAANDNTSSQETGED
jgi:hypothetical protein